MAEECLALRRKFFEKTTEAQEDPWTALDLCSQGIRNISRSLFDMRFIRVLNFTNNEIEVIPKEICKLRHLEVLNLSKNKIRSIPPDIGKIVSLKELNLNDNLISNIPMEIGTLYNLEVLEISNNPLIVPFNTLLREKKLLQFCREHNTGYPPPNDRPWIECLNKDVLYGDTISVGTFNILSNVWAARSTYAPSWVINPEFRREGILQEIVLYNVDILCLQEIELYSFFDFYKEQLEMRCNYDSIIYPRGRIKNVADKKNVDGCAIFWRRSKFRLIAQFPIDFCQKITQDTRFNINQELLDRYGKKDNIAIGALLERPNGQQVLVVNTHIFWDPDYSDVKLLQVILLIEEVRKISSRHPNACLLLQGDFNSLKSSSVYKSITTQTIDLADFRGTMHHLSSQEFGEGLKLNDSYRNQDLGFTNFTPLFKDVIDYIFYDSKVTLTSVLAPVEDEYAENIAGLPNMHFPSDHIFLGAKFTLPYRSPNQNSFGRNTR
ncbi:glucose-repressible alcohol dehydrogenase transcriptional effector [Encephalitozoon intestinalis ATCC 50506]|uniref:poly(A)-specific ribonuclease n=1 Tax=Encephalitozoon intestinalis (strain ATCC 50506) TaxID=876142 RepID=E0SAD9_ENCIT|nr:glucose-repressible alcohol dehydrogenase transcriptional effector [Encephalitozoon intestinalis ATCC 50506]ADM12564.1 glucose-repressible alcohol dehydrogenase transcriptional effector [Encephalitozoon intestinalis ATCC 50506]UTX46420.1 carbon catabolite repressor protein 4-like protein [Encephalitozoon intestinalis]